MTDSAPTSLPRFKSEAGRARYAAAYDAALAAWPVAHEARMIPTRFGATHVIVSGPADGPPLVLLPSFAGAAVVWRLNVATLSARYRTIAVDVIGQPGKSEAIRRLQGRRDYAAWLAEVLDGLGVGRAAIVGCSFGGFLALNQAVETPERVSRLVLISPAGTFSSQYWKLTWAMRVRAPLRRLRRRLTGANPAPAVGDLVRRAPRDTVWARLMAVTMAEAPQVSVINAAVFSRRQLRRARAPALLLIGEHETLYPAQAELGRAKARMPGLETALVPDADHIAAMAQPDDVGARILRFLEAG